MKYEQITHEELLGRDFSGPYMLVSQMPECTCCKCGAKVPAPGRMTYFDGKEVRTWCDCVTEDEMNAVALELQNLLKLYELDDDVIQA